jgi:hypothetical protein
VWATWPVGGEEARDYTTRTLDIENLIVAKMNKLIPEQYESILRPVFKDDEMLVVMVGAVLASWWVSCKWFLSSTFRTRFIDRSAGAATPQSRVGYTAQTFGR